MSLSLSHPPSAIIAGQSRGLSGLQPRIGRAHTAPDGMDGCHGSKAAPGKRVTKGVSQRCAGGGEGVLRPRREMREMREMRELVRPRFEVAARMVAVIGRCRWAVVVVEPLALAPYPRGVLHGAFLGLLAPRVPDDVIPQPLPAAVDLAAFAAGIISVLVRSVRARVGCKKGGTRKQRENKKKTRRRTHG